MKKNKITTEDWVRLIGKYRLQAYQDSYALLAGISLVFLDVKGDPITVWSNSPLFCNSIIEQAGEHCMEVKASRLLAAKEKEVAIIESCYLGIMNFYIPIFFGGELVAYCLGGGVADEKICMDDEILDEFHVPRIALDEFKKIANNMQKSLALLDISVEGVLQKAYGECENPKKQLFDGKLSPRETEVAQAICKGYSNKKIAQKLFISEKTVKVHVSNILLKLNIKDRVQLIVDYSRYSGIEVGDL